MDQYLKDSPSDYNYYDENKQNDPIYTSLDGGGENNGETGADEGNSAFNDFGHGNNTNSANYPSTDFNGNNFSLNIEQPFNQVDEVQYPTIPGTEFLSPNTNNLEDYSSSVNNEPFLEELDNLNFPIDPNATTTNTNTQGFGGSSPYDQNFQPASNNLDELISPHNYNTNTNTNTSQFLDSQHFSPRGNGLNFDTFSPDGGRMGSLSIPVQNTNNYNINSGSYLSPQNNSFVSPSGTNFDNSFDTLRSPNFGSYLNSPPQVNHQRSVSANLMSSSIPNPANNYLSPPTNTNVLGTSAPSGNDTNQVQPFSKSSTPTGSSSRQLTKEEKLQRRKQFHNEVERRRRDLIKTKIKELSQLVPPSLLNPQLVAVQTLKNSQLNTDEINDLLASVKVKESKPNKNTILNKSVVYVKHLQYVLQEQERTRNELESKLKSLQISDSPDAKTDHNFMQDFQNQSQSQYIKEEDDFNPDEFFSEIITGNDSNRF